MHIFFAIKNAATAESSGHCMLCMNITVDFIHFIHIGHLYSYIQTQFLRTRLCYTNALLLKEFVFAAVKPATFCVKGGLKLLSSAVTKTV